MNKSLLKWLAIKSTNRGHGDYKEVFLKQQQQHQKQKNKFPKACAQFPTRKAENILETQRWPRGMLSGQVLAWYM